VDTDEQSPLTTQQKSPTTTEEPICYKPVADDATGEVGYRHEATHDFTA
jgi:hypothetical protein